MIPGNRLEDDHWERIEKIISDSELEVEEIDLICKIWKQYVRPHINSLLKEQRQQDLHELRQAQQEAQEDYRQAVGSLVDRIKMLEGKINELEMRSR